ncbi:hypothetical protein ANCDUO_00326 [Ancylostoma duodenale]|uniref:Uncharacterized protein n=1 Tax=Ancylostoma duodenale TaxID=51022 RepID=A0A0C2HI55_9BILA|nr:hypothetical protein ANCDUO_00326 [Ancylostoma duodenale]
MRSEASIEMLGVTRLTQQSKIKDAAAYAKLSKIRWAGYVMRLNDKRWTRSVSDRTAWDGKSTTGRPPSRWSDFSMKSFKERYDVLRDSRMGRIHQKTVARKRKKCMGW